MLHGIDDYFFIYFLNYLFYCPSLNPSLFAFRVTGKLCSYWSNILTSNPIIAHKGVILAKLQSPHRISVACAKTLPPARSLYPSAALRFAPFAQLTRPPSHDPHPQRLPFAAGCGRATMLALSPPLLIANLKHTQPYKRCTPLRSVCTAQRQTDHPAQTQQSRRCANQDRGVAKRI